MDHVNIRLRAPEPSDLDFIYLIENDPTQWRTSLTAAPLSRHQLWTYLDEYTGDLTGEETLMLIIEDAATHESVGTVTLFDYDRRTRRAFLGVYVIEARRRQGVARAALAQTIEMAKDLFNLSQLVAVIAADNEPSQRLFTSLGFTLSGTLQSWLRDRTSATIHQLLL